MEKALQTTGIMALEKLQSVGNEIDTIIGDCLPAVAGVNASFVQSLTIAKGIHDLKHVMISSPEIKNLVMSMANNRLGFLTDRPEWLMRRNKDQGKFPQEPYRYDQLVDPIIEGLLKGYRVTNNEMNIISGQFYAAKNGNYRKVVEFPGVFNFTYNNDPVQFSSDKTGARVKCWATWKLNTKQMSIGVSDDDPLIIQVRVNSGMGEDAVIGKAHSKLFKRVLERISGQVAPESTDISGEDTPDAEIIDHDITDHRPDANPDGKAKDLSAYQDSAVDYSKQTRSGGNGAGEERQDNAASNGVEKQETDSRANAQSSAVEGSEKTGGRTNGNGISRQFGAGMDELQLWELFHEMLESVGITDQKSVDRAERFIIHNASVSGQTNKDSLLAAVNNKLSFVTSLSKWVEQSREPQNPGNRYSGVNSHPDENTRLDGLPKWQEAHPLWKDKWWNMRTGDYQKGSGLAYYINLHSKTIKSMPEDVQRELVDKFLRVYEGQEFPHHLDWMDAKPAGDGAGDRGGEDSQGPGMSDAEMRSELRAVRTDLVALKQQEPDLFGNGVKNLIQKGAIANKIPAQMSLDECNALIDEIRQQKQLRDQF